jgi:tRNA(Ile)-lysidine synthase TilS/MesJ
MNETQLYNNWIRLNKGFLESLSGYEMLLLFSGGKDSSAALDLLIEAAPEFGFQLSVHAGAYPVHRYPHEEREKISGYWRKRGTEIRWHDLGSDDSAIENTEDPCGVCQGIRKKMLARFLENRRPRWDRLVIASSYSLWDLVSYTMEQILGGMLGTGENSGERFRETAQRFFPVLHMKEGYTVCKPLVTIDAAEIHEHLGKQCIPTLEEECRFSRLRPKRILEDYYKIGGLTFDYWKLLEFAKKSLKLPPPSSYEVIDRKEYLGKLF